MERMFFFTRGEMQSCFRYIKDCCCCRRLLQCYDCRKLKAHLIKQRLEEESLVRVFGMNPIIKDMIMAVILGRRN